MTESLPTAGDGPRRALRFEASADSAEVAGRDAPGGARIVVLDTTWTPGHDDPRLTVRDAAERVLSARDLFDESTQLLDDWAERSGIVELLTIDGTSFWYQRRLSHWWWLHERLLWLGIVDALVSDERPTSIVLGDGVDEGLVDVVRLVCQRDGLAVSEPGSATTSSERAPTAQAGTSSTATSPTASGRMRPIRLGRLGRLVRRVRERYWPEPHERRMRSLARRLDRLVSSPPALLVLLEHARQRVETDRGPREVNPYLDPILDELGPVGLHHVDVELNASVDDDATWKRLSGRKAARLLPIDALRLFDRRGEHLDFAAQAESIAQRVASIDAPLVVAGVDFGPALTAHLVGYVQSSIPGRIRSVARVRRLLARLRPRGLLLADEYNRQDWLAGARAEGIPSVAIQHGGIQRRHMGYVHTKRPATLTLPDRTYVFGDWERRLLVGSSVYREDEVRVGGSPRLDLVTPRIRREREAVRTELRVAEDDRLVVISTTWGPLVRQFHLPIALARVIDRPLPNVHLVIKLHPGEPEDGIYRRLIDGVAAARGFEPPPISVVHRVDLYRLLAAADAHLGLYSTVITEAVFTGTPNLLAACVRPSDLLGYVEAGVATPVRDGGELLAALASADSLTTPEARDAFLRDHFEPGSASRRISSELVGWLGPGSAR